MQNFDVVIIGAGITGLCIAHQLFETKKCNSILILDKEFSSGLHTSGRNSGVLHAGVYYKPDSLKARVCTLGAKRLKQWIQDRQIPLNNCGKLIVPTTDCLDLRLDELQSRACSNGVLVEMLNENQLKTAAPYVRSASGRALWSPNTSVVKPIQVIDRLVSELLQNNVSFKYNCNFLALEVDGKSIEFPDGQVIGYDHLFNCSGLNADKVAHKFGIGEDYALIPFKGLYWQLNKNCKIQPNINVYPVPDLNLPFLGVHFTPSSTPGGNVSIGPTATIAFGRENYEWLSDIDLKLTFANIGRLAKLYAMDRAKIRSYMHEQSLLNFPPLLFKATRDLIPGITPSDLEVSNKVAIRPQLFNKRTQMLEDDFVCVNGYCTTHVLNAISPAFTASFELADLIIEQSGI